MKPNQGAWRLCFALGVLLILQGCAGFRAGVQSVAYVGDTPPALAQGERVYRAPTLAWPGLELSVELANTLQTRDHTVMLFVVPTSIDPLDRFMQAEPDGKARAFVRVRALHAGQGFRPELARLQVGDQTHATVLTEELRPRQPQAPTSGGTLGREPVTGLVPLTDLQRGHSFRLTFDAPMPSPEQPNLVLDLSDALRQPDGKPGPVVRFQLVRWKEGYTQRTMEHAWA